MGTETFSNPPRDSEPVADMPGFTHRFVETNGTRLHYVSGGQGPALVLLHGWPSSWREWRKIMPSLAASGRTVIAPDLRGTGDSDKPEDGYDKRNIADDLRGIVRAHGADTIDLVGTDIGAMVAFGWALHYPAEIRHLILAETLLPGFGLEELMNPATGGYWHFGFHAQVDVAGMLTEGKEKQYLGGMWNMFSRDGGITEEDRAEWLRTYAGPGGMRGGFRHYEALVPDGKANRAALGERLEMPVLVLNAEFGIPQKPLLDGAEKAASDVRSTMIEGAGHAFSADRPDASAQAILAFLERA